MHKYNYWTVSLLALLVTEVTLHPRERLQFVWNLLQSVDWPRWFLSQFRRPLNYVLAALLAAIAVIMLRLNPPLFWSGKEVALYPPHNLLHAAYVVFFLRLAFWWWTTGRAWSLRLDGRVRQLLLWHVGPVACWFLLPRHISYFLWFLSPANSSDEQRTNLLDGLAFYTPCIVHDYHQAFWCAALAAGLILLGVLASRRLSAGGQVIFWIFLLVRLLTALHPNHKSRYMHSWLATGWVAAGLGLASLVYGSLTLRLPQVRPYLATAAVVLLGCIFLPQLRQAAWSPEGGPHPGSLSVLDVTDAYLPDIQTSKQTIILAAVPIRFLAQWTFLEQKGKLDQLNNDWWFGFGAPGAENRQGFLNWLGTTSCDTLVFVDRLPGVDNWEKGPESDLNADLRDPDLAQKKFQLVKCRDLPEHGCSVLIFTANERTAQSP